jgi:hypothetical protein
LYLKNTETMAWSNLSVLSRSFAFFFFIPVWASPHQTTDNADLRKHCRCYRFFLQWAHVHESKFTEYRPSTDNRGNLHYEI